MNTVVANNNNIRDLVHDAIEVYGPNCDLNYIDVSKVRDMDFLFQNVHFTGSIDKWNVSNVCTMFAMFDRSTFNGNISFWDVSKVQNMARMFERSRFNGDLSKWNVSKATDLEAMFSETIFNGDIGEWDVSNTKNMSNMFYKAMFNRDISRWNTKSVVTLEYMFWESHFDQDISKWILCPNTVLKNTFSIEQLNRMEHPTIFHWNTISEKEYGFEMLKPEMLDHYEGCFPLLASFSHDFIEEAAVLNLLWHQQKTLTLSPTLTLPLLEFL